MTQINPPPLKVPQELSERSPLFWSKLIETIRLLWFYSPSTKSKILTGTTSSSEGGAATVAHGVTSTNIKSFTVVVHPASGEGRLQGDTEAEYQFSAKYDSTNITVTNHPTNSASILSKPFTAYLRYEI